jgi:hypothetical protein
MAPMYECTFAHYCIAVPLHQRPNPKKKHGVLDPMAELTITSFYVPSRVDSNTFTMGNPIPESTLTICQSRLYPSL